MRAIAHRYEVRGQMLIPNGIALTFFVRES